MRGVKKQVFTDEAILTVALRPPVIRTQPGAVTAKSGAKARFSVKANGPDFRYQWYEQGPEGGDWASIPGADKAELTFAASYARNGSRYCCRVWNEDGAVDPAAVLTVTPQPPKFSTQPRDARAKAGTTVTFKAKVSDRTATLQRYYRTSSGAPWLPLEGETGPAMTVLAEAADSFSAARPTPTGPPIPGSPP